MQSNRTGAQMSQILNPTNGYRGALADRGIKPKNHMAANRAALKQKEQDNQAKRDELANSKSKFYKILKLILAELFKMNKFKNVESKLS